jgi:hypothetical protein
MTQTATTASTALIINRCGYSHGGCQWLRVQVSSLDDVAVAVFANLTAETAASLLQTLVTNTSPQARRNLGEPLPQLGHALGEFNRKGSTEAVYEGV